MQVSLLTKSLRNKGFLRYKGFPGPAPIVGSSVSFRDLLHSSAISFGRLGNIEYAGGQITAKGLSRWVKDLVEEALFARRRDLFPAGSGD